MTVERPHALGPKRSGQQADDAAVGVADEVRRARSSTSATSRASSSKSTATGADPGSRRYPRRSSDVEPPAVGQRALLGEGQVAEAHAPMDEQGSRPIAPGAHVQVAARLDRGQDRARPRAAIAWPDGRAPVALARRAVPSRGCGGLAERAGRPADDRRGADPARPFDAGCGARVSRPGRPGARSDAAGRHGGGVRAHRAGDRRRGAGSASTATTTPTASARRPSH